MTAVPHQADVSPGRDWWPRAACRTVDPDLFFPASADGPSVMQIAVAKAVCARCEVRHECLAFALSTGQRHGVWGGTSPNERQRLRNKARAAGLTGAALVS
ncbi:MAG TPA: WhiB family transcriptional regulator [Streptosporangiaceae bacterium]|nr:WhiB family transcriptional regulator [Streptosporangiaceae bacterium]